MSTPLCHFNYLYRDVGNYKGYDSVILRGEATPANESLIRSRLIESTWFLAERIPIPTLYHHVRGDNPPDPAEDHAWHEFVGLTPAEPGEGEPIMLLEALIERLGA